MDHFWDYQSPMFSLVDPNDVCPLEEQKASQQPEMEVLIKPTIVKQVVASKKPLPKKHTEKHSKKLSQRERQLDLERQEAEQLRLRDHYRELIAYLEQRCKKLKEILQNIVAAAPHHIESCDLLLYDL